MSAEGSWFRCSRADAERAGSWLGRQEASLVTRCTSSCCVVSGQIDLEGSSGGWVIVPNHLVFIPAGRPFILRTAEGTVLHVAHLRPDACEWHR